MLTSVQSKALMTSGSHIQADTRTGSLTNTRSRIHSNPVSTRLIALVAFIGLLILGAGGALARELSRGFAEEKQGERSVRTQGPLQAVIWGCNLKETFVPNGTQLIHSGYCEPLYTTSTPHDFMLSMCSAMRNRKYSTILVAEYSGPGQHTFCRNHTIPGDSSNDYTSPAAL